MQRRRQAAKLRSGAAVAKWMRMPSNRELPPSRMAWNKSLQTSASATLWGRGEWQRNIVNISASGGRSVGGRGGWAGGEGSWCTAQNWTVHLSRSVRLSAIFVMQSGGSACSEERHAPPPLVASSSLGCFMLERTFQLRADQGPACASGQCQGGALPALRRHRPRKLHNLQMISGRVQCCNSSLLLIWAAAGSTASAAGCKYPASATAEVQQVPRQPRRVKRQQGAPDRGQAPP